MSGRPFLCVAGLGLLEANHQLTNGLNPDGTQG